jgi:hypothetical protein
MKMSAAKGSGFSSLPTLPVLAGIGAAVLVTAAIVAATGPFQLSASAKADFTLAATPTSRTAQQGQVASYTIDESKLNGFKDPVMLTASNLPSGSSATFSSPTLDSKTTSTLALTVGAATPVATYNNVTVTGTGGGITKSITMALTVQAATPPSFTLTPSPASASMLPGDTAAYGIATSAQNGFTGAISFAVAGAPTGSTTTFSPASVNVGGTTTLQVATKNNANSGAYTLTITGTSGTKTQTTSVALNLAATGKQFTIAAPSVTVPGPGASGQPLNLSLTNPNNQALSVTNLTVNIQSVTKAVGAPAGSCTPADYAVSQFGGTYPLTVPGNSTVSLSSLRPNSEWPKLSMLNSSSNQNSCKGATVNLTFTGAGQG